MALTDQKDLRVLDMTFGQLEEQRAGVSAAIRERMQHAKREKCVHPEAFRLARKLKGYTPGKRASFLYSFLHYVEQMGLDDQPDLLLESQQPTEGRAKLQVVG